MEGTGRWVLARQVSGSCRWFGGRNLKVVCLLGAGALESRHLDVCEPSSSHDNSRGFSRHTRSQKWAPEFAAVLGCISIVRADSRDQYDEAGLCFGCAAFPEMRAKSTDLTAQLCVSDRRRYGAESIRVDAREASPPIAPRSVALPATPKTHLSPFC